MPGRDNFSAMTPRLLRRLGCCALLLLGVAGREAAGATSLSISSPAFVSGNAIPIRHALAHDNLSPELRVANVPPKARSLVLIVDDPDAPMGLWTHWLVWNLPPDTTSLPEGKLPPGQALEGKNSFGHVRYDGPSPPSGTHRYFFRLYALDTVLNLPAGSDRAALETAMAGHQMGSAKTYGTYQAGQ